MLSVVDQGPDVCCWPSVHHRHKPYMQSLQPLIFPAGATHHASFLASVVMQVHRCPELLLALVLREQVAQYAGYLVELAMQDYGMLTYCYSMVAAGAVLAANRALGRSPAFPRALLRHAGYTEAAATPCAVALAELHRRAPGASLRTVFKKYSHASYGKVRGSLQNPEDHAGLLMFIVSRRGLWQAEPAVATVCS